MSKHDELRELERKATPAPWEEDGAVYRAGDFSDDDAACWVCESGTIADAAFIAAMRNATPGLLTELDVANRRADQAEALLEPLRREVEDLKSQLALARRRAELTEPAPQCTREGGPCALWGAKGSCPHSVVILG